jgi:hypothetical protein
MQACATAPRSRQISALRLFTDQLHDLRALAISITPLSFDPNL